MSSVKTQIHYDASRHMNFISTAPYNTNFWAYRYTGPSPSNSFTGVGALSLVTKADGTATNATTDCPAGRILRATGKKLYLDAAAVPAVAPWNDRTPLVGVYDYSSGLSGFIDPNQTMFAIYNVDKPVDATDEESSKGRNTHKGMSVYTGGSVTAALDVKVGRQLTLTGGSPTINFVATTSPYDFTQPGAVFVGGNSASTTLTVTSVSSGTITIGTVFTTGGTTYTVTALGTGTGGVGTYTISSATAIATGTTITVANQATSFYSFSNTGAAVTLNAGTAAGVPVSGTLVSILFSGGATTTLGSRFVATATTVVTTTNAYILNFVSNGTALLELSRSVSYAAIPTLPVAV